MAVTTANVTTSGTDAYTSSGNTAITWASLCNYTASAVAVDIHVVPNGGSATDLNKIVHELDIAATDTYQIYAGGEKLLLENGDILHVVANTNSSITSVVSYTSI